MDHLCCLEQLEAMLANGQVWLAFSKFPTRQLTPTWDAALHQTARIVCSTSFCRQVWVTGVTVYGTPVGPTHPQARRTTGILLDAAIERVLQSSGCRYLAGDWNGDARCLEAITKLQRLGFRDVQDIEFARTGQRSLPDLSWQNSQGLHVFEPRVDSSICPMRTGSLSMDRSCSNQNLVPWE